MSNIKILNSHLTNMIAAGEVVERPAGIVKELIENSLDAQASRVEIRFKEGGMEVIEVSDNGQGMSFIDLKNAFKRHSTSKITQERDLNQIETFGFRGEALPSIASVSLVETISNDGEESSKIVINNGKEEDYGPFPHNRGTSIKVYDLFSHIPARLKHIKNIHYESAIILDIVQKFALGNPDVSFTLYNNGKISFQSMGDGRLEDIYYRIYGAHVSKDSFYYNDDNYDFTIKGIYSMPNHNRANRYSIWIYVNKRMVRYPKLQNAIIDAYRRHLPPGRYPIIMMDITTDPELVDVNVHPSKWEIRMSQESNLINLVQNHIEKLLFREMKPPKVNIPEPKQMDIEKELLDSRERTLIENIINEKTKESGFSDNAKEESHYTNTESALTYKNGKEDIENQDAVPLNHTNQSQIEDLTVLSQMSGKYILAQGKEGLYIIDQHAAMERVRYEYFQNKLLNKQNALQDLLMPLVLEGRHSLISRLEETNAKFRQFQIHLEPFSEDSLIVRSLPQWLTIGEAKEFIEEILDLIETGKVIREEDIRRDGLASLACHSSVRFNEYLSRHEMVKLVEDLRACTQPFHCPHGRPTLISITHQQLIKEFKR